MCNKTKLVDTIKPFALAEGRDSQQIILEISLEDLQSLMKESIEIYNLLAGVIQDQKLLPQKDLARLTTDRMKNLQQEIDPITRFFMLFAYIKQSIKVIAEGFKARPPAQGSGETSRPKAITKIMLRAEAIIGRVSEIASQVKSQVSFTSSQAKEYITGLEGAQPSRRDVIRALQRAAQICPALDLGAVPGDLRGTKRLTLDKEDFTDMGLEVNSPTALNRSQRLQLREREIKEIFNLG
jgi:hypothetical protein